MKRNFNEEEHSEVGTGGHTLCKIRLCSTPCSAQLANDRHGILEYG